MTRRAWLLSAAFACALPRDVYSQDEGLSLGQVQPRRLSAVSPGERPEAPEAGGAPVGPSFPDLPVDSPADLGRIPALNSDEVRFMLQWQGGRYSPAGHDRLKDSLDPGQRVLTYRDVFGLLGERGSLIAGIFRRMSDSGPLPGDALKEAHHQYFNRNPFLREDDRRFFRKVGGIDWEGVQARIAKVLGGGEEAAGPPAVLAYGLASKVASRAAVPEVRLRPEEAPLSRIRIERKEGDDLRALDLLARALAAMLSTPTGRRLGRRLEREGPDVIVAFEAMSPALRGYTRPDREGILVRINSDWLKKPLPRPSLVKEVAAELAHQILGHALERHAAAREGLLRAYSVWRGDEENAARTAGLVRGELGGGAHPRACGYDAGPFGRLVLSRGELAKAAKVYRARLSRAGDPAVRRILASTLGSLESDPQAEAELRRAAGHPLFQASLR